MLFPVYRRNSIRSAINNETEIIFVATGFSENNLKSYFDLSSSVKLKPLFSRHQIRGFFLSVARQLLAQHALGKYTFLDRSTIFLEDTDQWELLSFPGLTQDSAKVKDMFAQNIKSLGLITLEVLAESAEPEKTDFFKRLTESSQEMLFLLNQDPRLNINNYLENQIIYVNGELKLINKILPLVLDEKIEHKSWKVCLMLQLNDIFLNIFKPTLGIYQSTSLLNNKNLK